MTARCHVRSPRDTGLDTADQSWTSTGTRSVSKVYHLNRIEGQAIGPFILSVFCVSVPIKVVDYESDNMEIFPFERLPAELRNDIFNLVFEKITTINANDFKEAIGPIQTCYKMRQETRVLYYNDKFLQLEVFPGSESHHCNFLDTLGADIISRFRDIVIVLNPRRQLLVTVPKLSISASSKSAQPVPRR